MNTASRLLIVVLLGLGMATCQKDFSINGNQPVTPAPGADITAKVQGRITDEFGDPVKGALVTAGTFSATTDINGEFLINNADLKSDAALVKVSKAGYFPASRTFRARQGNKHYVEIQLVPKVSIGTISGSAGGTISVGNGSAITLPANGVVVESSGAAYTGNVKVEMAWIDPSSRSMFLQMPGDLRGINTSNSESSLQSYGMLVVELTGSTGEKLQIASGKKATLKFPLPSSLQASAPATIPLWSFNETTGLWKEEGTAIKTGNSYTGDVSHFTYWNCDMPLTNPAHFTATFVDQNGQPLTNVHVLINLATGGYTGAHGMPDSSGYIAATVPSGQPLSLLIVTYGSQCQGPLSTQAIGPFAPGTTTNLGTITITLTGPLVTTVTGTAVDCSNNPVTNGTAEVHVGYNIYKGNITNGSFSVSIVSCSASQTATYFVTDNVANKESAPVTTTINAGNNAVGTLTACGISSLRFINYTIDGVSYNLASPPDNTSASDSSQGTTSGVTTISGNTAQNSQGQYVFFSFNGNTVGSFALQSLYLNNPTFMGTANVTTNPVSVTITEYGGIGGYVAGSFSGSFIDASNVTHTIQCNFRVRR